MSGVATLTLGPQAICNDEHALVEEGYRVADLRCEEINVDRQIQPPRDSSVAQPGHADRFF